MDDLISRQEAIDVLDKIFPADPMRNDYTQGITCGAALATEYIKQLPSAQPDSKELSFTHKALDTISRQDAIRIVDGIDTWQAGWRGDAIESMKALPSAQPETHEKRTETHSCDCIERQAAIDAVRELYIQSPKINNDIVYDTAIDQAHDALVNLPSTQPETAKRIVGKSRDGMTLWYQCDMCNEPVDVQDNFCRGCGRRLTDG